MDSKVYRIGGIVVAISILIGAAWLFLPADRVGTSSKRAPVEEVRTDDVAVPREGGKLPASNVKSLAASAERINVGDAPFFPKTQAQADWLNRNGYPTQRQMDAALKRASSAHDLDSRAGFTPERIIIAEQYAIRSGDVALAADYLSDAAGQGSIYALETMGRMYAHPRLRNAVFSEAYYRAAVLRGDWNGNLRMKSALPADQELMADLLAQQIVASINKRRTESGLGVLGQDLRPGLDEFLKEVAGKKDI